MIVQLPLIHCVSLLKDFVIAIHVKLIFVFLAVMDLIVIIIYDIFVLRITSTEGGINMASELIQLRVDDTLKQEAADIYSQLGLDLPTAIRMFLTRSVQVRGIPFSMTLPSEDYKALTAVEAAKRISKKAQENGTANMTMDEIDAEIAAYRSKRT